MDDSPRRLFSRGPRLAPPLSSTAAPAVLPLTLPSGKVLQVEVMVKDEDRAMGLMFRPSLAADRGMLFLFDGRDFHGIWMKNCKFPIDILWLDERARRSCTSQEGAPALHARSPAPSTAPCAGRPTSWSSAPARPAARRPWWARRVSFTLPR